MISARGEGNLYSEPAEEPQMIVETARGCERQKVWRREKLTASKLQAPRTEDPGADLIVRISCMSFDGPRRRKELRPLAP